VTRSTASSRQMDNERIDRGGEHDRTGSRKDQGTRRSCLRVSLDLSVSLCVCECVCGDCCRHTSTTGKQRQLERRWSSWSLQSKEEAAEEVAEAAEAADVNDGKRRVARIGCQPCFNTDSIVLDSTNCQSSRVESSRDALEETPLKCRDPTGSGATERAEIRL
jgi:hypothetical protein